MRLTEQAREAEKEAIVTALAAADGNVAEAARLLELPLRTLWRRLEAYGIRPDEYRHDDTRAKS
jgi:transcriptional regulator of acetoin/glycerol metabolism